MGGVLLALACGALLVWLPGLAVAVLVLPRATPLTWLAIAAPLSFAVLFAVATTWDLVGVRVGWPSVGLPVVLAALGVLGWAWRRRRRRWPARAWRIGAPQLVLAGAVLVALLVWAHSIGSPLAVPPYDDGANAGIFIQRILLLGTLRPDAIIATDLGSGAGGVAFYPLALHLVSAMVVQVTGVGVALAFQVVVALLACCAMPVGVFVLTRRVVGMYPGLGLAPGAAAGAAALAIALLPGLPWTNLPWGGLALVAGVALMPALLTLVIEIPGRELRVGLLLGAATAGCFAVHSSEVVSAFVIGIPMLVAAVVRARSRWLPALVGLLGAGVVMAVLLAPVASHLRGGLAERTGHSPGAPTAAVKAVHDVWFSLVSAAQVSGHWGSVQAWLVATVTALVLVGVWASRRSGVLLSMVGGSLALAVLAWLCLRDNPTALGVATVWYSNGYRIMSTLAPPLAVLVGVGVAWLSGLRLRVVSGPVLVALACLVAVPAAALSLALGQGTYYYYSVVTGPDRAAYAWLGAHSRPGERVLNDSYDGSMWMYVLGGAAPVFGPKSDMWKTPAWRERWYLLAHAEAMATDAHEQALARKYDVRYIVVGERVIGSLTRQLDPSALAASPALREVFRSGDAVVYEIVPTGA
jgi:hypothetical protein